MKAPERTWVFEINVQGDTREDACELLLHFLRQIEEGSNDIVSGGYSSGGILTVRHNSEVTGDSFRESLHKYLEERDAKGPG